MKRWFCVLALLGACGVVKDPPAEGLDAAPEMPPDASLDTPPDTEPVELGCSPTAPFTSTTLIAEVSTNLREERVAVSADEREMYLTRFVGGVAKIFRSRRVSASVAWQTPVAVDGLNTHASGQGADMISADGLTLYMTAGDGTSDQLMVATRATTDDEFVASAPLLNVNSGSRELWGTVDRDELMLQFVSDRDPSNSQFYRATRASKAAPFGTPAPVDAPVGMFSPTTVDNGLGLYYAVLGEGIFYTSRSSTSDPFPAGTKLDGTPGGWVTFISADHCRAYFAVGLPGGPGSIDIHVSTRDPR